MSPVLQLSAYGHSWVAGTGASRPTRRLVDLVAGAIAATPRNLGVSGSLSADTAQAASRSAQPAADVYLVMTGLNDARMYGGSESGLARYAAALITTYDGLARTASHAPVLAVEQPHLFDYSLHAPFHQGSNVVIDAYNETLRSVAARYDNVVLVRVGGWEPQAMLDDDTVHPNDAGHAQIAKALVQAHCDLVVSPR